MNIKNLIYFLALLLSIPLTAQETAIFYEINNHYVKGTDLYEKGVYKMAEEEFKKVINYQLPPNEFESKLIQSKAGLYLAKAAVRRGKPEGEQLILDFIRNNSPDPVAGDALIEMGNYYYSAGQYDKAAEFLSLSSNMSMSNAQRSEAKFKEGYCYFVQKQFPKAKTCFSSVKEIQGDYYYPSNYYYGMTAFFENNFKEAAKSFTRVEESKQYKKYVPYYLCQIYLAQKDYNNVIAYGKKYVDSPDIKNSKEIAFMLGQAYFEKEDYANAATYLTRGAEGNNNMRDEDYYQLGFVHYKANQYTKAIENLSKVNSNTKIGQNAFYLLGDSYLKNKQKSNARTAFGAASKMNFDIQIQDDALFAYAKLCYELHYDSEAVSTLQQIKSSSKNYDESQQLLSEALINVKDFSSAITIIEGLSNRTSKINEAYQKVTFYRGIQYMQNGDNANAKKMFEKSDDYSFDASIGAQTKFWLGDIAFQNGSYEEAEKSLSKFISASKGLKNIPDESSVYTASYTLGYINLKAKDYNEAQSYFQDAIRGIKNNKAYILSENVKNNILPDAIIRNSDCLFKKNKYDEAIIGYDEAINNKSNGFVYAMFQKAIILGLKNRNAEKVVLLEKIANTYGTNEYADDALLQAGNTYVEMNKLDAALKPLKTLTTQYKGKSDLINKGLIKLGLTQYNLSDKNNAINSFKEVFKNNPDPQEANEALNALQEIYVEDLGKPDEFYAFKESLPGYNTTNYEKDSLSFRSAQIQFENGNYDRAITGFTQYISKFPSGANILTAYYNRGESYYNGKKYTEAKDDYKKVVDRGKSANYSKALNKAALISYNNDKNFAEALDLYTKLEADPISEENRLEAQKYGLYSAYRIKNTKAAGDFAEKLTNNSRASKDDIAFSNYVLGKIAFDNKDWAKAQEALSKAAGIANSEQADETTYLLAYCEYGKRALDKALAKCDEAYKKLRNKYWIAKTTLLEADIHIEQDELIEARGALESIIENFDKVKDKEIVDEANAKLLIVEKKENGQSKPLINGKDKNNTLLELDNSGN
jgi:tetratricopeptide (TPR) repeat protein